MSPRKYPPHWLWVMRFIPRAYNFCHSWCHSVAMAFSWARFKLSYLRRYIWLVNPYCIDSYKGSTKCFEERKHTIVMKLDNPDFALLAVFLEGFFYGAISVLQISRPRLKQSNTALPRIGLCSGIFALYLHYHQLNKDASTGPNILFYTLCALYVLSFAAFVLHITHAYVTASVK